MGRSGPSAPIGLSKAQRSRIPEIVKDVEFIDIEGGPHNVGWTQRDEVNEALLKFMG